ncbi:nascent polypeptide-associated complex subunit alpha, muscle-specific form-like isoform X2 [Eublepharis macularius]|uniref:Nascent polypeptide-associated complex subunit alpha, muscle-specific form-like isoform X2 n=1 Tax=Eublepharis macularius TaxID=481883 RepID=A0AA97LE12_EUBMA|nr:nascent polypeptide-associated complex subunit alpha, muscle-specific form-like isoform X2 [Eublepharis macularius]
MRRLSRPQSPGSFLEPPSQWCLSPVRQGGPDRVAPTPSLLYRSGFAQECEAVVVQLSSAATGIRPRCAFTVQEETLTPLEPSCSFLDSPDGASRPGPEAASDGLSPPEPFVTAPSIEQQSLTGTSPGLIGGPSGPEWKEDAPPPRRANATFECDSAGGSANATYVCSRSPSPEGKVTPVDAAPTQSALGVCKQELPFITSTPLMVPPSSKDAPPTALYTQCPPRAAGSGSDSTFGSSCGSLSAAVNHGADQLPPVSRKAPLAKRNLLQGVPRVLRPRGAPGIGALPKGTGTTKKILQPAGGNRLQNMVTLPTRSGSAVQSQPVAQKLLPDEKTDLTKLPCNKKPQISIHPPSKLADRSGVQGYLACLGMKLHGASRYDNASGTRLPVPAGQKEKPTCSDLLAVGQISSAALENKLTAPCSQCQRLAEENQQLKSMLETCRKTIAFLEGKQSVLENENCPPQQLDEEHCQTVQMRFLK